MGFGHHGDGIEVEGLEGLAGEQACLGEVTLDPASVALCKLVLGKCAQQARGAPSLLIGLFGEAGPQRLDGGQA